MTPRLRFKEFHNPWKLVKLDDIADIVGGGTPDTENSSFWNGEIQWFTPSEIGINKFVNKSQRTITDLGLKNSSAKLLPINTLLFTSRATIGEMSILTAPASTNQGFQSIIVNDKNNFEFVYYLQNKIKAYSLKTSYGSTFLEISKSNLQKCQFYIPELEEQTKIATFLNLYYKKIELQKKKIEQLTTLRNEFIEQTVSLLNISNSKKVKLEDVLNPGNKNPVLDTSLYKKITIKLNNNGIEFSNISRQMADTRPFYIRNKDELIIGKQNYFNGSISIVSDKFDGCICSNAIMSFIAKHNVSIKYIYNYISRRTYIKKRECFANGTGQKELSEKDFLNFEILIPNITIQKDIVSQIDRFNKKLMLEQQKLNLLKKYKQGLLQKMFI